VPAVSFGVFDYTTDPKGCQGGFVLMGFVPIDILRVLVVYWIVYQCFFKLSTGYPQGCPQGSTGIYRDLQGSTGIYRVDLGQYGV
jgi:hypothetical protein